MSVCACERVCVCVRVVCVYVCSKSLLILKCVFHRPGTSGTRLVELKKEFKSQDKNVNLCIFGTDDDVLAALRIRNQRWRTAYEDRLTKLPTNFKGKQCRYLGNDVLYPTLVEFSN